MTDDTMQRVQDAEEHKRSYHGIMKACTEIGVPFSLGLTMFFTQLVMANGLMAAILSGIVVYVLVYLVVKMFFSH